MIFYQFCVFTVYHVKVLAHNCAAYVVLLRTHIHMYTQTTIVTVNIDCGIVGIV